jgi:hypothetical protein
MANAVTDAIDAPMMFPHRFVGSAGAIRVPHPPQIRVPLK